MATLEASSHAGSGAAGVVPLVITLHNHAGADRVEAEIPQDYILACTPGTIVPTGFTTDTPCATGLIVTGTRISARFRPAFGEDTPMLVVVNLVGKDAADGYS